MDDPEYSKSNYFDPVFQKQTYLHLIYSIISFPFLLVCSTFVLVTLITGTLLTIIWIGVPILNLGFISTNAIVRFDIKLTNYFTSEQLKHFDVPDLNYDSQLKIFLTLIKNSNTWKEIGYFFVRFIYSIIHFMLFGILVSMTVILIYTPFNAMFGHIRIFSFTTDLFIEAIFIFFISIILWVGIVNLINFWMKLTYKTTKLFFTQ